MDKQSYLAKARAAVAASKQGPAQVTLPSPVQSERPLGPALSAPRQAESASLNETNEINKQRSSDPPSDDAALMRLRRQVSPRFRAQSDDDLRFFANWHLITAFGRAGADFRSKLPRPLAGLSDRDLYLLIDWALQAGIEAHLRRIDDYDVRIISKGAEVMIKWWQRHHALAQQREPAGPPVRRPPSQSPAMQAEMLFQLEQPDATRISGK